MIITKHGNTMLQSVCEKCGCEFLYQNTDIKTEEIRITSYESKIECEYINCPECGAKIKIK